MIAQTKLTDRELCAVAFNCESRGNIPALEWNVTIPGGKPVPRPPQPPAVSDQGPLILEEYSNPVSCFFPLARLTHSESPTSLRYSCRFFV